MNGFLPQASLTRSVYLLLPSLASQETFHFLFVESSELDDAVTNSRLYIGQLHMHRVYQLIHRIACTFNMYIAKHK